MLSIVSLFNVDQKALKIDDDDEKIHRIVMMIIIQNIVNEINCKVQLKRSCRNKKCRKLKFFIENRN